MVVAITWLVLYEAIFLVLSLGLYQILRRFELVRRVVVTYHVLVLLLGALVFISTAPELGVIGPESAILNETFLKVFWGTLLFFGVLLILRLIDVFLVGYLVSRRLGIHISVLARHLAVVILLATTLILVLAAYQVPITPLLATSAVGSAIIGLALQDMLGNVVSGVALQAERPFKVGDWIQLGEYEGRVVEMNWRATRLATRDNDHVILPNSTVAREKIRNYQAPGPLEARHLKVGIEYVAAPARVKAVLLEATLGAEGVLAYPAPRIWLTNYGDFAITYEIKFWIDRFADWPDIEDRVMTRIWYLLRRNRITIPFPIRDVYQRQVELDTSKLGPQPGSPEVTAILRTIELLKPLSAEELQTVSHRLKVALYTGEEVLVHQDQPGDSFFIIDSGRVSVRANGMEVAQLGDRDHFGDMSLLTGQPRNATVVALTDTRVLIIDRECFETVLRANPAVAEKLSETLEWIQTENAAKLEAQGLAASQTGPKSARSILAMVRRFFRLE